MSMYNSFFNFSENPFGETPDRRFYFNSISHSSVMAILGTSLSRKCSLNILAGEVGTGKTLLSRILSNTKSSSQTTALLLNPILSPAELVQAIVEELATISATRNLKTGLAAFEKALIENTKRNNSTVLIVDEAQCLPLESLKALLKIHSYTTAKALSFHVVLMGQPEILKVPLLNQLDSLVLKPLSLQDMKQYVFKRIEIAGGNGFINFGDSALTEIYRESQGLPRLVNRFCELTLLAASRDRIRNIDRKHVSSTLNCWPQLSAFQTISKQGHIDAGTHR